MYGRSSVTNWPGLKSKFSSSGTCASSGGYYVFILDADQRNTPGSIAIVKIFQLKQILSQFAVSATGNNIYAIVWTNYFFILAETVTMPLAVLRDLPVKEMFPGYTGRFIHTDTMTFGLLGRKGRKYSAWALLYTRTGGACAGRKIRTLTVDGVPLELETANCGDTIQCKTFGHCGNRL